MPFDITHDSYTHRIAMAARARRLSFRRESCGENGFVSSRVTVPGRSLPEFAHDRRRYLYWLFEAKKRYIIIDLPRLAELCAQRQGGTSGCDSIECNTRATRIRDPLHRHLRAEK
jgi:hypothetical protein